MIKCRSLIWPPRTIFKLSNYIQIFYVINVIIYLRPNLRVGLVNLYDVTAIPMVREMTGIQGPAVARVVDSSNLVTEGSTGDTGSGPYN